ncbi:MAG TPA: 3-methyl-2-oxobutanoate hydroxymethyltransferase [Solirubrobacteraceae bacterium]|jgi:3-methyl-2-oxobutanoate hydroxymethyltransferase|nr:3-methyl-2-oxobutanoate hydroxymethyltransferase [Solirubrobacteraceae bacterium]
MSSDPTLNMSSGPERLPMTIPSLMEHKRRGQPLVMVTCYDYPSARIVEEAGVDLVLVGDTAAMTVLGYDSTVSVTVDELLVLVKAVRRGLHTPLLVGDLPFGSYEVSDEQAVTTAQRFVKEARCDAVKLEGGGVMAQRARAIASTGIPVVGHVGLTPQTATAVGGFKAQGRTSDRALQVVQDALALQDAGCCCVVFEAIPAAVAEVAMERIEIPVIGIGAGSATDGQVLVWHDLLGLYEWGSPRFVKRYAELRPQILDALQRYSTEVRAGEFPSSEYTYSIDPAALSELRELLT